MFEANHTGNIKWFYILYNLQEYSIKEKTQAKKKKPTKTKTKTKPFNEETFACFLTTLKGFSFLPYRGKPWRFTVHQTQVCILQPLKCVCAAIRIA